MSENLEGIRAGIGKPNLIAVIEKAAEQFQDELKAAQLKQEEDIQAVMARKRKGFPWNRRNFTHSEARWYLLESYRWQASYDAQKAAEKLRRLTDLNVLAQSAKLDAITLSEKDLMMLKDFL